MNSQFLRAAAAATLWRRLGFGRCLVREPATPQAYQAHRALRLYSYDRICTVFAPTVRHMGSLHHPVHTLIVNPPAAVRRASRFNSPAAAAAGNNSGSNRCSSSSIGGNGDSASAATFPALPCTRVADSSSHWLPSLARAKIRQGVSFTRLSAAAKGDWTSADVLTVEQKALHAVRREGWSVPGAAVVLFSAHSSKDKGDKAVSLEFAVISSEEAPLLLRVFGVAALPHCLLMVNGRVVCELPAGSSAARQDAFVAAVSSTVSTDHEHKEQTALLHKLKEDLLVSADTSESNRQPTLPRRTFGMRNTGGAALKSSFGLNRKDDYQAASPADYLLDSDERAAKLAALATVALFDAPAIHIADLQALHEVLSWAMHSRRASSANKQRREPPPVRAGLRATLEKVLEREEPQWAPDDCPIIRRLPLYNQCLLNKSLFAKAPGAQPLRSPRTPLATPTTTEDAGAGAEASTTVTAEGTGTPFPEECLKVELWRLAEWLARTRRCLSSRLFLDKAEASALDLAMTAHVEWLEDAATCNYMQINVAGQQEKAAGIGTGPAAPRSKLQPGTVHEKEGNKKRGVHPFNVWFEPRAPSAGRTLLTCMYTALGPDDRRVQQTIGRFDVAVKAHEFYPVKFPHTKARRGGKPRMMRGRSGRWFWLGPYWRPPWAPKGKSFTEDWHLTNAAA
ncbi:hypothetical protein, conserved [Eimeria praecox]|uniref:Uncharacterized protein n=1 Tax=Eimeria praecox TaxID=51316 RepID=U6G859_9EIME|nr:hypothetical protein, conserved [Eimeria praecox]